MADDPAIADHGGGSPRLVDSLFFGIGSADRVESYQVMFGETHTFLPVMNGSFLIPSMYFLTRLC